MENACYFAEKYSHLDALTQNLQQSKQICYASTNQNFQKDNVPIDPDLMCTKQPDSLHKKNPMYIMLLNIILGLHIMLANPKPGIA